MGIKAAEYPHSFKRQVFLYETDAFGHANNVTFFQYMESARFELMKELRLFDPSDILSCNYILAHAECDYRQISRYNDTLVIFSRVSEIRTSSFVIEHLMLNEKTGHVVATGRVVLVAFNHRKGRSVPLTKMAKKALKSLM